MTVVGNKDMENRSIVNVICVPFGYSCRIECIPPRRHNITIHLTAIVVVENEQMKN